VAHANTPPTSAKVEQGKPYSINPGGSDSSRLRGAPVGRSRGAVAFCTTIAVCKRGVCSHPPQGNGSWGGTVFSGAFFMKAQHLSFQYGEGKGSQPCVERQHVSVIACGEGDISPSIIGGYWRFGWKENLNLKKCVYSATCFDWCGSSEQQKTTGAGG